MFDLGYTAERSGGTQNMRSDANEYKGGREETDSFSTLLKSNMYFVTEEKMRHMEE